MDQLVDRLGIRNPEQGLGQAHEAHALFGREAVFGKECFHHRWRGFLAHTVDISRPGRGNLLALRLRKVDMVYKSAQDVAFIRLVILPD